MLATWGWAILLCPLAGCVIVSLGFRVWPGRVAGWIGTLAIACAFAASIKSLDRK